MSILSNSPCSCSIGSATLILLSCEIPTAALSVRSLSRGRGGVRKARTFDEKIMMTNSRCASVVRNRVGMRVSSIVRPGQSGLADAAPRNAPGIGAAPARAEGCAGAGLALRRQRWLRGSAECAFVEYSEVQRPHET